MAALATSSGLLLVLAFPKFNLFPLSAIALGPLLLAATRETQAARRWLWGTLAGVVYFTGTCYWIYTVMRQYGELGTVAAGGVLGLLCLVLSLYWGCFAWLAGYLWRARWGPLAVPFVWVALELARAHLFTGFPWLLLGYALVDYPGLAHLARWTGVYGLSFLLVSFNVAWVWMATRRDKAAFGFLAVLVAGSVLSVFSVPSVFSVDADPGGRQAFLVQTDIPQEVAYEKWDLTTQGPLLDRLESLTTQAVARQEPPALVIWPEMPASFYYHDDSFTQEYAGGIARRTNSFFLMGIVAFVPGSERAQPLNSNVLLSPSGSLLAQYDKIHLVPFGEYVPLQRWLWFAERLTAEAGDFVPGSRIVVSQIEGGRLSAFICYEAIFPDLVRRFAQAGAEVLVNISNDGWFGSSGARYQHLLMARMRAIENNRYLLRATNTGLTAVIRPDGRIAAQILPDRAGVLEARWAFRSEQTFYTRHGDWFAYGACLVAIAALAAAWHGGKQRRRQQDHD